MHKTYYGSSVAKLGLEDPKISQEDKQGDVWLDEIDSIMTYPNEAEQSEGWIEEGSQTIATN